MEKVKKVKSKSQETIRYSVGSKGRFLRDTGLRVVIMVLAWYFVFGYKVVFRTVKSFSIFLLTRILVRRFSRVRWFLLL